MIDGGEAIRKLALHMARFSGIAPLARPFAAGLGAILMLHRVTATPERPYGVNRHLNIAPEFLEAVIADMKAIGYHFVSLDEAVARIERGGGGGRFATITADDAYRDNLTEALPILEKHRAPMTIYVAPALIDGGAHLWWDVVDDVVEQNALIRVETKRGELALDCSTSARKFIANSFLHDLLTREVPEGRLQETVAAIARRHGIDPDAPRRKTLMDWNDIAAIADHPLVTIGAHTVHHVNLHRLDEAAARREIADAPIIIADHIGEAPRHMAYPYGFPGAVGCREVGMARAAGFVSAVTTRHGVLHAAHASHLHALPRISVNGRYQRVAHIRTMLSGVTTPIANAGRMVVTV